MAIDATVVIRASFAQKIRTALLVVQFIRDGKPCAALISSPATSPRDMFLSNFSTFTEWADELDRAYDWV